MRVTLLGTGTSGGVPSIGCQCEVCRSTDPHDKRLRCSALLETETTRVLIDCGPDFRQQVLPLPFQRFDGILLTHIHYDHVSGIDDLRPFCVFGDINIYANQGTVDGLKTTMPYCFTEHLYPGVPRLNLHVAQPHVPFTIGDIDIMPIEVMHHALPILGFRIGSFAYITDMKTINEGELPYLMGVKTMVVNALRFAPEHHSHQTVDEAIAFVRRVGAKHAYLIHPSHHIGLHKKVNAQLPQGIELAYDGQVIEV
ncbi:MAG: MBL fold metallo-hydrolase [Prevotella sp.]|nr:MBL fold metallo-hydrolase [Prevotella sp.]